MKQVPATELSNSDLTDQWGDELELAALFEVEHEKREKALRAEAMLRNEDKPAAEEIVLRGKRRVIELSARRNERQVLDMYKLYRKVRMGLKAFLENCKVTMKFVDARIPEDQQEGIVHEERSGPRAVKLIQ